MKDNERLAKLLGLCWHEWSVPVLQLQDWQCIECGIIAAHPFQPDFSSDAGKVQILREMFKRKDYDDFLKSLTGGICIPERIILAVLITDTTGQLAKKAIEFLESAKAVKTGI